MRFSKASISSRQLEGGTSQCYVQGHKIIICKININLEAPHQISKGNYECHKEFDTPNWSTRRQNNSPPRKLISGKSLSLD